MNYIQLGRKRATVKSAELTALISDRQHPPVIRWGVEIHAYCDEIGEDCELECVELLRTDIGDIERYIDLFGRQGGWSAIETSNGEARASLSIWEHVPVNDVSWVLGRGPGGDTVQLTLEGTAWIDSEPDFGGDVQVGMSVELDWKGFACGNRTEKQSRERLARMGFLEDVKFVESDEVNYLQVSSYPT